MVAIEHVVALLAAFGPIADAAWSSPAPGASRCKQFAKELQPLLKSSNAKVTNVQYLKKNSTIVVPEPEDWCEYPSYQTEASMCRVEVTVKTSSKSSLLLEAWLPDTWYGRYLGTGNGGHAGCLRWTDLNHGAYYHFATVSTNNGHKGDTAKPFLNNNEILKDFVYRSIEVEAAVGKKIVNAYYGKKNVKKSYYTGCSTGGRQGFKAVQDYPELFDGVVIGAPGIDWNSLIGAGGVMGSYLGLNGQKDGLLSPTDLELINADVSKACDMIDGVKDGIIDEPDKCKYDARRLLCKKGQTKNCLCQKQVTAVQKLFTPIYGRKGELIAPRFDPHVGQADPQYIFGPDFYIYALDWYRYAIYKDADYNMTNFSYKDLDYANKVDPYRISTINPDISKYAKKGGKILTFHGTADELLPQGNTMRYYNKVQKTLHKSQKDMDKLWRHFQIPGMWHCSRGPAAWQFAQSGTAIEGLQNKTENNLLLKIVDWVEGGKEPTTLTGTKFWDDEPAKGVQKQRTYCAHPKKSVYKGKGSVNAASSWKCV